jgi:PHP family Zn ribbon phosphoesterase
MLANTIPVKHLLPLDEIIAAALEKRPTAKKVLAEYDRLIDCYESELGILLGCSEEELAEQTPPRILEGVVNVRHGAVNITPGYDGEYGKIELFPDG